MSDLLPFYSGGCLCGAFRYLATADFLCAGFCFCCDCRKASGSGCIPFMSFDATVLPIRGPTRPYRWPPFAAARPFATRAHGAAASSLAALSGRSRPTIYAGSLDAPAGLNPQGRSSRTTVRRRRPLRLTSWPSRCCRRKRGPMRRNDPRRSGRDAPAAPSRSTP